MLDFYYMCTLTNAETSECQIQTSVLLSSTKITAPAGSASPYTSESYARSPKVIKGDTVCHKLIPSEREEGKVLFQCQCPQRRRVIWVQCVCDYTAQIGAKCSIRSGIPKPIIRVILKRPFLRRCRRERETRKGRNDYVERNFLPKGVVETDVKPGMSATKSSNSTTKLRDRIFGHPWLRRNEMESLRPDFTWIDSDRANRQVQE